MTTLNLQSPTQRPFGQRVGKLTRFGETWLDLDRIDAIEFSPKDGCGCEIVQQGSPESFHMRVEDAECLRAYLTGFESIEQRVNGALRAGDYVST